MLPENTLLEIFDFYRNTDDNTSLPVWKMAHTGARMSKMATNRLCVTTPSQSPNSLHTQNSCQEESPYLAGLAYRFSLFRERQLAIRGGRPHCRARAPR